MPSCHLPEVPSLGYRHAGFEGGESGGRTEERQEFTLPRSRERVCAIIVAAIFQPIKAQFFFQQTPPSLVRLFHDVLHKTRSKFVELTQTSSFLPPAEKTLALEKLRTMQVYAFDPPEYLEENSSFVHSRPFPSPL